MILLSKLFEKLSFNELSNLSLSNEGSGQIVDASKNRIVSLTNDALLALHTRFLLKEKELVIQSLEWKSEYLISSKHAVSNDSSELKYIMDTSDQPYLDDLIEIQSVYNEGGQELPINNPEQYASVFTPRSDLLQLTHVGFSQAFFIVYRAKPDVLYWDSNQEEESEKQEIHIPAALENILRYRIAADILGAMNGQEYLSRSQFFDAKYDSSCIELEERGGLGHKTMSTNVKLHRRGFP